MRDFHDHTQERFYQSNQKGQLFLPSRSYFLKTWRNRPELKHIKVRKYHKFTLCNICVYFTDQRRLRLSVEERRKLLIEEREHHKVVNLEKLSYYERRKQAIYNKKAYTSIIIDGADQSAHGLPHVLENDKLSSSCMKIPLFIMALVHGVRAWR